MSDRVRDPVLNMPLLREPPIVSVSSARARQRRGVELAAVRRTNQDIVALKEMTRDRFTDRVPKSELWPTKGVLRSVGPA